MESWKVKTDKLHRQIRTLGLGIITAFLVVLTNLHLALTADVVRAQTPTQLSPSLPAARTHPLPDRLAQWQDPTNSGDYFSLVRQTAVGYLVWSRFPVKVYVERPTDRAEVSPDKRRFDRWAIAVLQAVREWSVYLPLEVVVSREIADIKIERSRPPLKVSFNRNTGKFQLPRARSAQTRYELYTRQAPLVGANEGGEAILSHRCTIQLSPDQSDDYIKAAALHELGHALGIWGHSLLETDALYFSQVRNPPPISTRDINTLKRVYEQPTRLGWSVSNVTNFTPIFNFMSNFLRSNYMRYNESVLTG